MAVADNDRCLVTCIVSDETGRGYWCDDCPNRADRCPGCGHAPHATGWCENQQSPPCDCPVDDTDPSTTPG